MIVLLIVMMMIAIRYVVLSNVKTALSSAIIDGTKVSAANIKASATESLFERLLAVKSKDESKKDEILMLLKKVVNRQLSDPKVVYAYIIDNDSKIVAWADRTKGNINYGDLLDKTYAEDKKLKIVSKEEELTIYEDSKGEIYHLDVPLTIEKKVFGIAKIGVSQKSVKEVVESTMGLAIKVIIGILVIGIIGALLLAHYIVTPIHLLVGGVTEIGKGNFDQQVKITSNDEIGELTTAFNKMAKELKERETIKDAFTRYVSKDIMEQILKDPEKIKLGGERKQATIFFSDIRNFTTMSEKLKAEELLSILNEYFTAMTNIVIKNDGYLNKFIGDGLMAIYGVPLAHENDPKRAVKSAIEMQQELKRLHDKWRAEGKPEFNIGIGISTGEVIAGNIGALDKMDYTVIGDEVNVCSRIEGLNKNYGTTILVGEGTYQRVKDDFDFQYLGETQVKGKTEKIKVYEVKGEKKHS